MNIAVIGLGSIGQRHVQNLRALGCLVRGEDADPSRAFSDVEADEIGWDEAFVIATPATSHRLQGCPRPHFVEKPLSESVVSARSGFRCDEDHRALIQVGYQLRFDQTYRDFRAGLPLVGRVLWARIEFSQDLRTWRPGRDYRETVTAKNTLGGGILLEASHELDLMRWLFGDWEWLQGWCGKISDLEVDVEDTVSAVVHMRNGLVVELHLDMVRQGYRRRIEVAGTKGNLSVQPKSHSERQRNQPYLDEMAAFLKTVQTGELHPDAATFEDGIEALRLVEAIRLSSESGTRQFNRGLLT